MANTHDRKSNRSPLQRFTVTDTTVFTVPQNRVLSLDCLDAETLLAQGKYTTCTKTGIARDVARFIAA